MTLRLWVAGVTLSCACWAQASTLVQLSLPGINLPASQQVTGARLSVSCTARLDRSGGWICRCSLLSDTNHFTGVQFALGFGAARVRQSFNGVAVTAFNWHEGQGSGG